MPLSPPASSVSVIRLPGDFPWHAARAVPAGELTLVTGLRASARAGGTIEALALAIDTPDGVPRPLLSHQGAIDVVAVPLEDGRALVQVADAAAGRTLFLVDPDAREIPAKPVTQMQAEDGAPIEGLRLLSGFDGAVPVAWCPDPSGVGGRLLRLGALDGCRFTATWAPLCGDGPALTGDAVPTLVYPTGPESLLLVGTGGANLSLWHRAERRGPWQTVDVELRSGAEDPPVVLSGLAPWPPTLVLAARTASEPATGSTSRDDPTGAGLWGLDVEGTSPACRRIVQALPPDAGAIVDLAVVPTAAGDAIAGLLALTWSGTVTRAFGSADGIRWSPISLRQNDTPDTPEAAEVPLRALALAPGAVGEPPRVLVSL